MVPILFIIDIKDVDVEVSNLISKFAEDAKMDKSILTAEDRLNL